MGHERQCRRTVRPARRRRGPRDRRAGDHEAGGTLTELAGALVVLWALAVDLAFGDPPNRWHPVAWMGAALAAGRNWFCRGGPARLVMAGGVVTLLMVGLSALAGGVLSHIAVALGPVGLVLEAVALKMTLSVRGLAAAAHDVSWDLAHDDLPGARATVGRHLVSRPTAALDAGGVASAGVESVAENLTDAIAAPLMFYLAFGLPGAFAFRALNTADAMLGYRQGALEHFGKVAARLDDAANLVPARLAALTLVIGAVLIGADGRGAWRMMWRDHAHTSSPNAGWTIAAMAGALGVRLEKPGHYVLGEGRTPGVADVERAIRVMHVASALVAAIVAMATLAQP